MGLGSFELFTRRKGPGIVRVLLAAVVLGAIVSVSTTELPQQARLYLWTFPRAFGLFIVCYIPIGWTLARRERVSPPGKQLVLLSLGALGLSQIFHASQILVHGVQRGPAQFELASAAIGLIAQIGLALGIAGWLLSDKQEKAASAVRAMERSGEELRQAQKMEAIGRLAGGVAHDFNNLLTAIQGYSELLALRFSADDRAQKEISSIRKAAERAAALTHQLLAMSRRQVLREVRHDLRRSLTSLEPLLRRAIAESVTIRFMTSPEPIFVLADPGQIEVAVLNLALNARDAMPRGGLLTIELKSGTAPEETARVRGLESGSEWAQLSVRDTGTGMDERTRRQIFEPFFTTKPAGNGAGLGLSTSYGIVAQSGGFIEVESTLGEGSTFLVYLPRVHAGEENSEPDRGLTASPSQQLSGIEIFYVEDESALRELVEAALVRSGARVRSFASAEAAWSALEARSKGPGLALLDVVLPGMSGVELGFRLRERWPELPLLFVSGYSEPVLRSEDLTGPGRGFLRKPFTLVELLGACARLGTSPAGPSSVEPRSAVR
ncbi:MAG: response regulator [Planctomycetes bacterium]|nr:response regulator [Planctomycetota bacterium]